VEFRQRTRRLRQRRIPKDEYLHVEHDEEKVDLDGDEEETK
jgi:hypothetical protein